MRNQSRGLLEEPATGSYPNSKLISQRRVYTCEARHDLGLSFRISVDAGECEFSPRFDIVRGEKWSRALRTRRGVARIRSLETSGS